MSPEERQRIEGELASLPEPDLDDPDNAEWTDQDFARAKGPETLPLEVLKAFPLTYAKLEAEGRLPPATAEVTLDLDTYVLDHFRATGPGWRSRINIALQEVVRKG